MTAVREAVLVADRRFAQHELRDWLGVPSRKAHRQTDRLIDRMNRSEVALSGAMEVIRWR